MNLVLHGADTITHEGPRLAILFMDLPMLKRLFFLIIFLSASKQNFVIDIVQYELFKVN